MLLPSNLPSVTQTHDQNQTYQAAENTYDQNYLIVLLLTNGVLDCVKL